jgi:hypothetical protein
MTVVLSRDYFLYPKNPTCWVCGERLYHPPFVTWTVHGNSGGEDMVICAGCCRNLRDGLMADLIHLLAIVDLRAVATHYNNFTLVRTHQDSVDATAKAEAKSMGVG